MEIRRIAAFVLAVFFLCNSSAWADFQPNGKLQIHYMDVGQGDGAILVSPMGQIVMFDNGVTTDCAKPVAYIESLGITHVDYHINSHYHADHFGCADQVFSQVRIVRAAYDRGTDFSSGSIPSPKSPSPTSVYGRYVRAVGDKRRQAQPGEKIILDANSQNPVTLTIVAANGNGIKTQDENDLSVVALVEFGAFKAEFGGDLSGEETKMYQDIETSVAPSIGRIDVYKVHHHCSSHSSNNKWLETTKPTIGIVSVGNNNRYGHPAEDCLTRLHDAGVKTYWTEQGKGAEPDPQMDKVVGSVVVEVAVGASQYSVSYSDDRQVDNYAIVAAAQPNQPGSVSQPSATTPTAKFVWSKTPRSITMRVVPWPVVSSRKI